MGIISSCCECEAVGATRGRRSGKIEGRSRRRIRGHGWTENSRSGKVEESVGGRRMQVGAGRFGGETVVIVCVGMGGGRGRFEGRRTHDEGDEVERGCGWIGYPRDHSQGAFRTCGWIGIGYPRDGVPCRLDCNAECGQRKIHCQHRQAGAAREALQRCARPHVSAQGCVTHVAILVASILRACCCCPRGHVSSISARSWRRSVYDRDPDLREAELEEHDEYTNCTDMLSALICVNKRCAANCGS